MNRRLLGVAGLALLVLMAGCSLGGGELSEEDLAGDREYQWDAEETVVFDLVSRNSYTTVVRVENRSTLPINQRTAFRGDQPVEISALQFRFENGTVVNATHPGLSASTDGDRTTIGLPAENGTVAYTAPRGGRTGTTKSFSSPVIVEGSYRLDLPESARVGIPFLSQARPGGYETTLADDRMTLRWESLESGSIAVRYYLVRDLYLFGSIAALGVIVGVAGAVYYLRQIRRAKRKREEVGLDVEYDDDSFGDDGPPPGMR